MINNRTGMKKFNKQAHEQNSISGIPAPLSSYHVPVLINEVLHHLDIKPDGIYVDCTFGGGGHSLAILKQLNEKGKLIAFDQDTDAKENVPDDQRLVFVASNFRHLQRFLRLHGIDQVDGILADLGVSSHQFDVAERGFSIRFEGALDMRMDQRQTKTAIEILKNYAEEQLHKMFEHFGEVTNAKTLARTIVESRKNHPIQTISGFRNAVSTIIKGNPNKYLAQVFQALRIEVNDELGALKEMLEQAPLLLKQGGKILVISFHSIEDRVVKTFFRDNTFNAPDENPFENIEKKIVLKPINKKPIEATAEEIRINPRARSAKLRVAQKI